MAPPLYDPVNSALPTGTPESRTWRPWPLRWPFLVAFITLCIALCVGIQLVVINCKEDSCHIFEPSATELSAASYFVYNQLPTVLNLFLSLVWAVAHHDIMRLEPYFRMSAAGGASAADSLLLDYPYTFAPFVPFVAGKRRHYLVFLSSCISLILTFLVTPMISGIFDDGTFLRRIDDSTAIRAALRPVAGNSTLSGAFTFVAYRADWLNGSLPRFTNAEYAVLPVGIENNTRWDANETWTAATTLYEAELVCEPAGAIDIFPVGNRIKVNITSQDGNYNVRLCDQQEKNNKLLQYINNRASDLAASRYADYVSRTSVIARVSRSSAAQSSRLFASHAAAQSLESASRSSQSAAAARSSRSAAASPGSQAAKPSQPTQTPPAGGGGGGSNPAPSRPGALQKRRPGILPEKSVQDTNGTTLEGRCDGFTTFITPWTAIALRVPSSQNGSSVYLYGWARGASPSWPGVDATPEPANITAMFCVPRYFAQDVTATFSMPEGQLQRVNRPGKREPFLDLLNFDQIINGDTGALGVPRDAKNRDGAVFGLGYRPWQAPNSDSQLQRRLGARPANVSAMFTVFRNTDIEMSSHSSVYIDNVNGLPGLALSSVSQDTLVELLDPKKLEQAYDRALRTMFALAVTNEMVSLDGNGGKTVEVTRRILVRGFGVNMLWAHGAQGGLMAVALMATLLTVMMGRRPCNLDGEPNSLAEALRLLAASPEVSAKMANAEFHHPNDLAKVLADGGSRYQLDLVPGQGPRLLRTSAAVQKRSRLRAPRKRNQRPWAGQLWQLREYTGMGFLLFFGGVGLLLAVSFGYSQSPNGIPLLTDLNSFGYKVLFSNIPVAIGKVSDPILIAIATCQCMMAPYTMLARPTSWKALTVDFDKSPPHFQIIRSIRTRNGPLALLTISILLCDVLAVALAGLFSVTERMLNSSTVVVTYPAVKIKSGFTLPAQEVYFLLAEQLSGDAGALPFTTPEYYVVPVVPVDAARVISYNASTIGIGLDVNCTVIPQDLVSWGCDIQGCETWPTDTQDRFTDYNITVDDECWGNEVSSKPINRTYYPWRGLSHDNIVQSPNCQNSFFPLWAERPWDPNAVDDTLPYAKRLESLVMRCDVVERAVELGVVVGIDQEFLGISTVRTLNPQELYASNDTARLAQTFIDIVGAGILTENSPDPHKIRWLNHLMRTIEPRIVRDAANMTHIPDEAHIARAFEDVYRHLFALNLKLSEPSLVALGEPQNATVPGSLKVKTVDVNGLMFSIAGSVIVVIMVVLVFLYWRRQQTVGYLPQSLAGMYALLYASNAKEECGELVGRDPAERAKSLEDVGGMYVCGRFADGQHYGVHRVGKSSGPEREKKKKSR